MAAEKKSLSRRFWQPAKTKISTGPSPIISDGHGFPDPRGSVGMGVVGMGVGDYFFTHAKPTPIAVGVVGSHSYGCMGLMVGFLHKI